MKKMSNEINIKVDKSLAKKALKIAKKKYQLRKIVYHSDAVREIIIDFVKKNKGLLKDNNSNKEEIEIEA